MRHSFAENSQAVCDTVCATPYVEVNSPSAWGLMDFPRRLDPDDQVHFVSGHTSEHHCALGAPGVDYLLASARSHRHSLERS